MRRLSLIPTLVTALTTLRSFSLSDPRLKGRLHLLMGLDALDSGKGVRAVEHLRQAVALEPEHNGARLALGVGLLEMNLLEESTAHLRRVLAQEPSNAQAQLALAASMALERQGALPEA